MSAARKRTEWKIWILALFLMLIGTGMASSAQADLSFQPAVNYSAGSYPFAIGIGDFNRDGKLDLAVANYSSNDVSILLGNGEGSFTLTGSYGAGTYPNRVTVGDFNGDGRLDLAVAHESGNYISVLLGNGDGTFQARVNYTAASYPFSVAVADFNRDGKLDLAVANNGSNNVSILLGNGDGTFQAAVNYGAGNGPVFVASGDFNGDGTPDLVVTNVQSNNVSILLGNGDGTFQTAVNYAVGHYPQGVGIGDFNGDGKLDLTVANYDDNNVSILQGNGNGTFQAAVNYGAGSNPFGVATGDFDGDGMLDLAVANAGSNNISLLLGNGNGTFQSAVNYSVGSSPRVITTGDFNHDGKLDLSVPNLGGNNVSILLNNSDFDPANGFRPAVDYGTGSNPYSFTAGDFNGDSKLDLAVANYNGNNVSILLSLGDGTFQPAVNYAVGPRPYSITIGDFNRDGKLDLAVANQGSNTVSILLGNGDGTFTLTGNYGAGTDPFSVTTGDFNRDGKLDLAVANYSSNNVSVLLGNGNGTFQTAVNYGVGFCPWSVTTGDFNRDGKLDLAVANSHWSSSNVSILLGVGDGTFQAAVNYGAGDNPVFVVVSDFDGDGKPDLAVANGGNNNVSILLGDGNGTFQGAVNYAVGDHPYSVTTGDFDRDGKLDLAVANYSSDNVSILLGVGDGTFQGAVNYGVGSAPRSVATGDFDRDGKLDLAVANWSSNNVSVLINTAIYTVTATAGANGSISPSGSVSVFSGDNQSFTITPNACYHVADVLVNGVSQGAVTDYTFNNVTADHTIDATFAIDTETITASAGANGSISPSGIVSVNCGSNQSFTITPNANYHVADVLVDGVSQGGINNYQFNDVIADHTISVSFAIDTYTITATAGTNGSISPSGTVTVNHGSSQSFTITPSVGYHIADVLVDGVSQGPITSFEFNNVTANHTISASFAINTYTITASAGANGSISPSGAVTVNHGNNQSFTITPDVGYHVDDVLVDGISVGSVTSHQFNNVTANHTVSASFMVTSGATTPTGTTDAGTGYAYTYSTSGTPGDGDLAEYQFDWKGDESDLSPWGSSTQTKNWSAVGTHTVRARARCALHTSAVSDWSSGLRVVVVDPNFVDFSINDGAASTLSSSVTLTYTTTGNPGYIRTSIGTRWGSWQDLSAITPPHTISLGSTNGIREVFAQVKDDQGRVSPVARASIILDTTAPKGVVKINGGNTTVADGSAGGTPVRLHLAMFDANMTGAKMRIRKDTSFVSPNDDNLWEDFVTGKDVNLTAGSGTRKVYVQFKDGVGKPSSVYSDSINVVATGGLSWPGVSGETVNNLQLSGGTGTTYSTDTDVTLSCSLADYTGLSARYLRGTLWTPWEVLTGNNITEPLALSTANGPRQVYMQLKENSSGRITDPQDATIILDTKVPTGVIQINNGTTSVPQNTASVTLTIVANDYGSGIDKVAIYQTGETIPNPINPNDPRFQDFAPTVADYALNTSTTGTKTVYVWVKDKAGKISAPIKDTISIAVP
ncbi:MAG: hypothetical protein A2W09_00650 [Deltaproteobacteria bacterium RBG_16_50_11]|nr:MAG: hypothetical protein A2W09_00650 [Deltaproteobacteria bacterium RBG_16_50_11]